jgi:hypothetical protein
MSEPDFINPKKPPLRVSARIGREDIGRSLAADAMRWRRFSRPCAKCKTKLFTEGSIYRVTRKTHAGVS